MLPLYQSRVHADHYRRLVSTRTLLFLAALTGFAILLAFAVQVMVAS